MLFIKWPRAVTTLVLCILCICVNTPIHAQSLKAQQATLASYNNQLGRLKTRQQEIKANLATIEAKLKPLQSKNSPEKEKLDAAKALLDKTTATQKSSPSTDNKAKMSNAAFKYALAERKFKKANARQFELEQQNKALNKELDVVKDKIYTLKEAVATQQETITRLKKQYSQSAIARQEQQRLQKQRDAELEIQRLRSELAKQKQNNSKPIVVASKPASVTAKKVVVPPASTAIPIVKASKVSVPKKDSTPKISKPAKNAATDAKKKTTTLPADGAFLLTTKKQVRNEELRLVKLQTKTGKKRSRYNKILNIKTVRANGSISRPKANTLRALGQSQYRAIVKLKGGGEVILIVGMNKWRQRIPSSTRSTEYVFLYDLSNKKPRLVYYDKSLSSK